MKTFYRIILTLGFISVCGFVSLSISMIMGTDINAHNLQPAMQANLGSIKTGNADNYTKLVISGILPNPTLTPGATNPNINGVNYRLTLCNPKWSTKTIRPPSSYTTKLKIQQIKEYGFTDTNTADFEEDHLISLELGGDPTSPSNLWPESYKTSPNAKDKDKVENYLHKQLCLGLITLTEAQREISTNWVDVLNKMGKSVVPAGSLGTSETDD